MLNLNLKQETIKALNEMGITIPTEIQSKTIPVILSGKDVIGQSKTGSGKTLAFAIPIVEKINSTKGVKALILTPTRELCVQVEEVIHKLTKHHKIKTAAVFGGVSLEPQREKIHYASIVVGTPGRILDHIERKNLDLSNIEFVIIDEADKMLEIGFIDDVKRIVRFTPKKRQTILFSATISAEIKRLIHEFMNNPVHIKTETYLEKSFLKQVYYDLNQKDKYSLLVHLLKNHTPGLSIVFCQTRHEVTLLTKNLKSQGIKAVEIHGGIAQNKRLKSIDEFKNQGVDVLVATDVAARGIDVNDISHIYNYDVPKTSEEYIHRIGRTARAGKEGCAVTLLCERDHDNFRRILMDHSIEVKKEAIPEFERLKFINIQERRPFNNQRPQQKRKFFGPRRR